MTTFRLWCLVRSKQGHIERAFSHVSDIHDVVPTTAFRVAGG